MSVQDQVANLLTCIRNGSQAHHRFIDIQWTTFSQRIVEVLKRQGYLEHFLVKHEKGKDTMRIFLGYSKGSPVIRGIRSVSNPGRRVYVGSDRIPTVFNGLGSVIVSTSQGVLVGTEARKRKVGGELLCTIW